MQNMAERLAENSHDIWAKKKKEELMICGRFIFIIFKHEIHTTTTVRKFKTDLK